MWLLYSIFLSVLFVAKKRQNCQQKGNSLVCFLMNCGVSWVGSSYFYNFKNGCALNCVLKCDYSSLLHGLSALLVCEIPSCCTLESTLQKLEKPCRAFCTWDPYYISQFIFTKKRCWFANSCCSENFCSCSPRFYKVE